MLEKEADELKIRGGQTMASFSVKKNFMMLFQLLNGLRRWLISFQNNLFNGLVDISIQSTDTYAKGTAANGKGERWGPDLQREPYEALMV